MAQVSFDELMGFISMKVLCPDNPRRNLALRWLAGNIVYQTNLYTTTLSRKAKRYTKDFGPAGEPRTISLACLDAEDCRAWHAAAPMVVARVDLNPGHCCQLWQQLHLTDRCSLLLQVQ